MNFFALQLIHFRVKLGTLANPNFTSRQFSRLVLLLVAIGFAALVIALATAGSSVLRAQQYGRWVSHTYDVEQTLSDFRTMVERSEAARRGFLLTGSPRTREIYQESAVQLPALLAALERKTVDNAVQQRRLARLRVLTVEQVTGMNRTINLAYNGNAGLALSRFRDNRDAGPIQEVRALTQRIADHERQLLGIRTARQERTVRTFFQTLLLTGVLLISVAAGTFWVILRYTSDIDASRNALKAFNERLEDEVRERTADLQRANEEIQRFAYIVSHDLRSPLVNVMGFTAELDASAKLLSELIERAEIEAPAIVTADARLAAREDLPEAIGFIRSSTQKMDRLINAILRLSREGRRVITSERIEMAAMIAGIRDSLQHRLDELDAEIRIEQPLPPIHSDRLAIEQIFSNLIENAVKYLKPGRPGVIVIRGVRQGERILYEIEDNGRGIDPKDHARVFDLFRRSGVQDQPGEGIGLAHVRALAYRLGGVIDCISELDRGAVFRLALPAYYTAGTNMSEGGNT